MRAERDSKKLEKAKTIEDAYADARKAGKAYSSSQESFSDPFKDYFEFDADDSLNDFRGWYIDDVFISGGSPCFNETGTITLDRSAYSCGDLIEIDVRDLNVAGDSLSVELSTENGDVETVTLLDSDGDKLFSGTILCNS